jgi:hypothetical protein
VNWDMMVKKGDLVKYRDGCSRYSDGQPVIGLVLYVNEEGGTVKVLNKFGNIDWFVTSDCKLINESR